MRERGAVYSVLGSLGCYIVFCFVFFHEEDPYFVFNSVVDFIVGFSSLTSSLGSSFKTLLGMSEDITFSFKDFLYRSFTADAADIGVMFKNALQFVYEKLTQFQMPEFWWG